MLYQNNHDVLHVTMLYQNNHDILHVAMIYHINHDILHVTMLYQNNHDILYVAMDLYPLYMFAQLSSISLIDVFIMKDPKCLCNPSMHKIMVTY